jgi:hypothetical protein
MEHTLSHQRGAHASPATPTDPVGMWYVARARHGISDNNWFGFATRGDDGHDTLQWQTVAHRDGDGIGVLTQLLHAHGCHGGRTPTGRDSVPPAWRELLTGWRAARRQPQLAMPSPIRWHYLDASRAADAHAAAPQHRFLSDHEYAALRAAARQAGVSGTNWLAWTLDRALRQTLVESASPLRWVYPVNLRGAVQVPAAHMNQCGGLALVLRADNTAADMAAQLRLRFSLLEHWRSWALLNLGRRIGQTGVNLAYRLAREAPGSWAGSYSNLGAWPLPGMSLPAQPVSGVLCSSPGSPAYPVSTGIVEWQGRLALACRVHPVADADGHAAARLLEAWQARACGN